VSLHLGGCSSASELAKALDSVGRYSRRHIANHFTMIERAKSGAVLSLASLLCVASCRTLQYHEPYLHLLETDSTEIAVHAVVRIGFSFANMTGKPISGGCYPLLEKKVGDKWKLLPANSLLDCSGGTFESGVIFHTEFEMLASNIVDDLSMQDPRGAKSIDGIYRLRWPFVEGRDSHSRKARPVSGVSNEFTLLYPAR
jgi:hypothetical protein